MLKVNSIPLLINNIECLFDKKVLESKTNYFSHHFKKESINIPHLHSYNNERVVNRFINIFSRNYIPPTNFTELVIDITICQYFLVDVKKQFEGVKLTNHIYKEKDFLLFPLIYSSLPFKFWTKNGIFKKSKIKKFLPTIPQLSMFFNKDSHLNYDPYSSLTSLTSSKSLTSLKICFDSNLCYKKINILNDVQFNSNGESFPNLIDKESFLLLFEEYIHPIINDLNNCLISGIFLYKLMRGIIPNNDDQIIVWIEEEDFPLYLFTNSIVEQTYNSFLVTIPDYQYTLNVYCGKKFNHCGLNMDCCVFKPKTKDVSCNYSYLYGLKHNTFILIKNVVDETEVSEYLKCIPDQNNIELYASIFFNCFTLYMNNNTFKYCLRPYIRVNDFHDILKDSMITKNIFYFKGLQLWNGKYYTYEDDYISPVCEYDELFSFYGVINTSSFILSNDTYKLDNEEINVINVNGMKRKVKFEIDEATYESFRDLCFQTFNIFIDELPPEILKYNYKMVYNYSEGEEFLRWEII